MWRPSGSWACKCINSCLLRKRGKRTSLCFITCCSIFVCKTSSDKSILLISLGLNPTLALLVQSVLITWFRMHLKLICIWILQPHSFHSWSCDKFFWLNLPFCWTTCYPWHRSSLVLLRVLAAVRLHFLRFRWDFFMLHLFLPIVVCLLHQELGVFGIDES